MGEKGIIISGKFSEIVVRQKHGIDIELGELMISESKESKHLMQVYDLVFGSQLSDSNLELVSGMKLEEDSSYNLMDEKIRHYNLALLKNLITINKTKTISSKSLPKFFSNVREVNKEDLNFLTTPKNPLYVGNLRSGSKTLDVDIFLPGKKVFSHHILIPATTGRGKSNLASVILWSMMKQDYAGILVLDPHDEYYGHNKLGLKDHPKKENLIYYTPKNPPAGQRSLKINLKQIKPSHFHGATEWSPAQREALTAYHRRFKEKWIEAVVREEDTGMKFNEGTISVLKRRLISLLNLEFFDNKIYCRGIFDTAAGETTIADICNNLEQGKIVVIDTSNFSGSIEILVGSLIASEIFSRYKRYKTKGELEYKPVISILLEEAPRVLGKEVL